MNPIFMLERNMKDNDYEVVVKTFDRGMITVTVFVACIDSHARPRDTLSYPTI